MEIILESLAVINIIGLLIVAFGGVNWWSNDFVKKQEETYRFDSTYRWYTNDNSKVKKKEKKLLKELHRLRNHLIRDNEKYRSIFIIVLLAINMVLGSAYLNLLGGI